MKNGRTKGLGVKTTDDVYLHKLRCSCGSKLRKNRWHQRKDGSWSYGYRCYRAINNGSKAFREQNGLETEGYCNGPMICDWKFDIMAVTLFNRLWKEKGEAIIEAYNIYNRNYVDESTVSKEEIAGIEGKLDRAKNRLSNLICMRADGEISKDEYSEMKSRCEAEIERLQNELTSMTESDTIETRKVIDIDKIKERLQELTTSYEDKVPSEIIEAFVAAIIPEDDGKHFSWYLTLDDDEYHQSFCTLEGRKNTLRLDVQTVEDEEGALPTFFHNQYFAEAEQIGKNPYQRGVLHRLISKILESNIIQII